MPEWESTLDMVTEDVLGTMFFSTVLGFGPEPEPSGALTAMVEFAGSARGVLCICADRTAAVGHTASFLGLCDSDPQPDEVQAVVGELANVICGAALAQIYPMGQFRIAPPRVFDGEDAARQISEMPVLRRFELPEGALSVAMSVSSGDPVE
jgi:CheY-specific phosphatase CheX